MLRITGRTAAVLLLLICAPVRAHFGMLLPRAPSTARNKPMAFVSLWGHPFEHELSDAAKPQRLLVLTPDGKRTDLTATLEKQAVKGPKGKNVVAYGFRFTPGQRGDYTFLLTNPPVRLGGEKALVEDTVKVVLHVQAQKGWDRPFGRGFELVPLTRPYGLQPGMVFQAQALVGGKPLAGAMVEVERYNPAPPKQLPPDEQITRRVKTDPNGVLTCTLPEAGWWGITAERDGGQRQIGGKKQPIKQRSTLWVYVDPKP